MKANLRATCFDLKRSENDHTIDWSLFEIASRIRSNSSEALMGRDMRPVATRLCRGRGVATAGGPGCTRAHVRSWPNVATDVQANGEARRRAATHQSGGEDGSGRMKEGPDQIIQICWHTN